MRTEDSAQMKYCELLQKSAQFDGKLANRTDLYQQVRAE